MTSTDGHIQPSLTGLESQLLEVRLNRELLGLEPGPVPRVGRFEIVELLGRGGMGVVYRARDPKLDREVALKLIAPELAKEAGYSERALREAQLMARLDHPHVVSVYETGEHRGRIFVAMQLVEGHNIRAWIQHRQPSSAECRRLILEAGRGLMAAHAQGLVHLDFKPENILVGADARAQVADFGLSRLASDSGMSRETAGPRGTPGYIAPEQLRGHSPGPAADQFSFAVTMWEICTGERPTDVSTTSQPCSPPKSRPHGLSIREYRALTRALADDPDARWPSMAALISRLHPRHGRGLQLAATGIGLWAALGAGFWLSKQGPSAVDAHQQTCSQLQLQGATTWNNRRRARIEHDFLASGYAYAEQSANFVSESLDAWHERWTTALLASCSTPHEDTAAKVAQLRCRRLELDATQQVIDRLAEAEPSAVKHAGEAVGTLLRSVDNCGPNLANATSSANEFHALILAAETERQLGHPNAALEVIAKATDLTPAVRAPELGVQLELLRGRALYEAGQPAKARQALHLSLQLAFAHHTTSLAAQAAVELIAVVGLGEGLFEQALVRADYAQAMAPHEHRDIQATLARYLGAIHTERGDYGQAEQAFARAVDRMGNADRSLELARVYRGLGRAHWHQQHWREALEALNQAQVILRSTVGAKHPEYAAWLIERAELARLRRDYAQALEGLEQAEAILNRDAPEAHLLRGQILGNRAAVHWRLMDSERGLAEATAAEALLAGKLGEAHPESARALIQRGRMRSGMGQTAAGLEDIELGLARLSERIGADHPNLTIALINLAHAQQRLGQMQPASAALARAVSIIEASLGPVHTSLYLILRDRGRIEKQMGNAEQALELFLRAAEVAREKIRVARADGATDSAQLLSAYADLGSALRAANRYQEALKAEEHRLALAHAHRTPPDRDLALAEHGLASSLHGLGRHEEEREHLRRAVAALEHTTTAKVHLERLRADLGLALAHGDNPDFEASQALLRRAWPTLQAAGMTDKNRYRPDHPTTP